MTLFLNYRIRRAKRKMDRLARALAGIDEELEVYEIGTLEHITLSTLHAKLRRTLDDAAWKYVYLCQGQRGWTPVLEDVWPEMTLYDPDCSKENPEMTAAVSKLLPEERNSDTYIFIIGDTAIKAMTVEEEKKYCDCHDKSPDPDPEERSCRIFEHIEDKRIAPIYDALDPVQFKDDAPEEQSSTYSPEEHQLACSIHGKIRDITKSDAADVNTLTSILLSEMDVVYEMSNLPLTRYLQAAAALVSVVISEPDGIMEATRLIATRIPRTTQTDILKQIDLMLN